MILFIILEHNEWSRSVYIDCFLDKREAEQTLAHLIQEANEGGWNSRFRIVSGERTEEDLAFIQDEICSLERVCSILQDDELNTSKIQKILSRYREMADNLQVAETTWES